MSKTIGVIGAGAWGTALAQVEATNGHTVILWAREMDVVSTINAAHENMVFLPGVKLHKNISATSDINDLLKSDVILLVAPTQFIRAILVPLKDKLKNIPIVICSKGVEIETGQLPSEIVESVLPGHFIAVLTGPTFAIEVARGFPAAVTVASADKNLAEDMQKILGSKTFRIYTSSDMIGAQLGAAIKNVIAIACGIAHGKGLGENARAALITRGSAEIARLAEAMGGRRQTLMGLCGIGDLVLTCSSMQSRNFSLGAAIGQGKKAADVLGERKSVAEGYYTAKAASALAKRFDVDMPISATVAACLNDGFAIGKTIESLLNRPLKEEI
ncbi:MAG: NAD(P)H-dependent glycerol-3-phosphate dehydrogenase [Alphaproteobacteria bacterium]